MTWCEGERVSVTDSEAGILKNIPHKIFTEANFTLYSNFYRLSEYAVRA